MSSKEEICSKLFDIQKWISNFELDNDRRKALCFRETLTVELKDQFTRNTKPIGGFCILVDSIGPQSREFIVHVQSSMTLNGHFRGSKMINSSTEKFHCLEEKRTEFVYKDSGLHKNIIYLGYEEDMYHMKLIRSCPCNKSTESRDLNFCSTNGFLSEGGSVLLMRYLALKNYEGSLSFESVDINGNIVNCKYDCKLAEKMDIDGRSYDVYTIERTIYNKDKPESLIRTYLSPQGKILQHNWLNETYLLKMNPFADPNDANTADKICVPLRDRWPQDIEMMSKYLDMKYQNMTEQMGYLEDHPEIKNMIADYVETLLVVKPEDVVEFTIQHFKAFAKDPKVWEKSALDDLYEEMLKIQLSQSKSSTQHSICGTGVRQKAHKKAKDNTDVCEKKRTEDVADSTCSQYQMKSICLTGADSKDIIAYNLNKFTNSESEDNLEIQSCPPDITTSRLENNVEAFCEEEKINVMSILNQDNAATLVETRKYKTWWERTSRYFFTLYLYSLPVSFSTRQCILL